MQTENKSLMRYGVGSIITLAWVISLTVGFFTHDYEGTQLVTPIMIIYVSYLYGDAIIKRRFPSVGRGNELD